MTDEALLRKYEKTIRLITYGLKNIDNDTKEDIMQDLRLCLLNDVKPKMSSLDQNRINNYIFVLLKRKAIDILRSNKYKINVSLNQKVSLEEEDELIDLIADDRQEANQDQILVGQIEQFIELRFNKRERMLIRLYFYEKLTYKQVGKKFNVSADTARRHIEKIVEIIKKEFTQ